MVFFLFLINSKECCNCNILVFTLYVFCFASNYRVKDKQRAEDLGIKRRRIEHSFENNQSFPQIFQKTKYDIIDFATPLNKRFSDMDKIRGNIKFFVLKLICKIPLSSYFFCVLFKLMDRMVYGFRSVEKDVLHRVVQAHHLAAHLLLLLQHLNLYCGFRKQESIQTKLFLQLILKHHKF